MAKTIDLMVRAQKQAVEFGVTQDELDRVISLRLEAARQAAATGRTGSSARMADGLALQLNSDPVFVSPADSLALLEEQAKTVTLAEVNAALRARFTGTPTLVYRGSSSAGGRSGSASGGLFRSDGGAGVGLCGDDGEGVALHELRRTGKGRLAAGDRGSRASPSCASRTACG